MITNLKLPQNLNELSSILDKDLSVDNWSGAVVFLLVEDSLVFIRRSLSMPTHKGQIAFMGGYKKDHENDPVETALREFEEESAMSSKMLEFLGLVYPVLTVSNELIIPVVSRFLGSKERLIEGMNSNGEWDEFVIAPISFLANMDYWVKGSIFTQQQYSVYFAPLLKAFCFYSDDFEFNPYILWGASAKMVLNFFQKHQDSDR